MSQTKYREYYAKMVAENRQLFDEFLQINDLLKKIQSLTPNNFTELDNK